MNKLNIVKTTVHVGLETPVRVLHVTDTHICLANEEDALRDPELPAHARDRAASFGGEEQIEDYFTQALEYAQREKIPVLHTGDLYDFMSEANFAYFEKTLGSAEHIYAAGNHDFCHFVGRAIEDYQYKWEGMRRVQPHIRDNLYFDSHIIGGLNFVTLDDGYYLLTKGQEECLRAEAAKGYPIVLCMHVPLYTPLLAVKVMEKHPCAYLAGVPRELYTRYSNERRLQQAPDTATLSVIDYILSEKAVKAVVAGHVHVNYEEPLINGVPQICTDGSYAGQAREITFI